MKLPSQLQQEVEAWAICQGISTEQFVLQAIAEKIDALSQQTAEGQAEPDDEATNIVSPKQAKIYRKEGISVVDVKLTGNFDINTFIDELREERIREQITW